MDWIVCIRIFLIVVFGFYLSRTDLRKNIVPDKVTLPLISIGLILSFLEFGISTKLIYAYLIVLGVYFFFVVLYSVLKKIHSSQTIGGGDVKFTLMIASLLPFYQSITGLIIIDVIVISFIVLFVMSIVKMLSIFLIHKFPKSQLFLDSNINNVKVTYVPILWISTLISLVI
jgi:Flp pilus assembly protein protease CpaA